MTFQLGDYSPPDGQRWQAGEDVISQLNNDGYIEFRDGTPFRRYFEDEEGAEHDPFYCFMEVDWASTSEAGKNQLNQILGDRHDFDTVKPVRLIKTLVQSCTSGLAEDVILDFFSGSATTSHAVMELNAEDGGKRRHILVQLPESNDVDSDAYKAGFTTIAEIGKERIRRSSKKIKEENADKEGIDQLDIGFRVLKIDTSNMKEVYYTPDAVTQEALPGLVDNIRADRTAEDLLFQVLLDWGVDLALPISRQTLAGKTVFFVDGNALAACFDTGIDEDFVKQLAAHKPLRVVFRDAGFISDSVKINVEQVFKLLSPATEIKTL
jgi:adenine-specific DNA-methyltransferase